MSTPGAYMCVICEEHPNDDQVDDGDCPACNPAYPVLRSRNPISHGVVPSPNASQIFAKDLAFGITMSSRPRRNGTEKSKDSAAEEKNGC